ncbi:uncharacterized protein F4812DRAFT_466994 [Daldinia caldariorum]|uniref:uncharacterized protein n=1 Tax=Daldinia caldariorum TaxID=326644 RepID=UPI002007AE41|nr:uncharacterized protein F4812DRAFT_466994 [Daldinia caldariorum]KAI1464758.1 hypothetical protein F4812DRAFT_466994 [Daldinia caldariorum]
MPYNAQCYGISVALPFHMVSSEHLSSAYVSDGPYYKSEHASSQGQNVSYASYSTIASNKTSESMLDYQSQSLPPASVPSIPNYVVGSHNPTDVNMGSSGGASFTTPTGDPFGLPFYQTISQEPRSIGTSDTYHHPYPSGYGAATLSPRVPPSGASAGSSHKKSSKQSSRPRKSKQPQVLSPGSTSSASNSGKSRLRSASRTSKNTHHNPPASAEEQKSRETHNQVEKQYRNRLNAHFESLLNALPETMQAGEGEGEGDGEALDVTDRRVSKAEVLDMARRHIQALERECAALEGERDELRNNMERLRWLFGRCEGPDGFNEQLNLPGAGGLT